MTRDKGTGTSDESKGQGIRGRGSGFRDEGYLMEGPESRGKG